MMLDAVITDILGELGNFHPSRGVVGVASYRAVFQVKKGRSVGR